jgi:ABC-type sugar transport system substrate-binding protein
MRRAFAAAAAVLLAVGVAACGSSSDDAKTDSSAAASTTAKSATTAPSSSDKQARAKAAGAAAATKEGGPVTVPKGKTVALLNLVGTAESSTRGTKAAQEAAHALGWKLLVFDAGGDAGKAAANIQAAISQAADALVSTAITPALMTQGLKQAQAKGIPVINIYNGVDDSPVINGSYVQDYNLGVGMLTKEIAKQVGSGSQVGLFQTPLLIGYHPAVATFNAAAKENGWKVVQSSEIALTDIEGAVQRNTSALLGSYPSAKALFIDLSPGMPVAAQVLKQRHKCGKVLLYGDHDDLINQKTIAEGCGTALASYPVNVTPLMAFDQLAEYFARDKKPADLPKTAKDLEPIYGLNLLKPQVLTKANLPATGSYPEPVEDFQTFFATKWADEFKVTLPQ